MSELSKKYEDVSNGLVDAYKLLSEKGVQSEVAIQLITCSMNIQKCIRQFEAAKSSSEITKAANDAIKEIGKGELLIEVFVKSGIIAKEQTVSILKDCMMLRGLIESNVKNSKGGNPYDDEGKRELLMGFEKLLDEYYDKIYVFIFHRVSNSRDTENLTAAVFLKAFARPYNPRIAKFSAHIYTIAANVLKNHTGKADALADCKCAELKTAVASLPEQDYAVVYRRYYLDESFREISAALSVTESGVWRIHERSLKKLKKLNSSSLGL